MLFSPLRQSLCRGLSGNSIKSIPDGAFTGLDSLETLCVYQFVKRSFLSKCACAQVLDWQFHHIPIERFVRWTWESAISVLAVWTHLAFVCKVSWNHDRDLSRTSISSISERAFFGIGSLQALYVLAVYLALLFWKQHLLAGCFPIMTSDLYRRAPSMADFICFAVLVQSTCPNSQKLGS